MHYNIDYSKIIDTVAKQNKAMEDIKNYLGAKKMKEIEVIVKADPTATRANFVQSLSMFVGIEGYPAQAWADHLKLAPYTEEELEAQNKPTPIVKRHGNSA